MSKLIELTDEQFRTIENVAAANGQSPGEFLARLIDGLRDSSFSPQYLTEDDFLRRLGLSEEMIQRADALAKTDDGAEDTDV